MNNSEIVVTIFLDACRYDYREHLDLGKFNSRLKYLSGVEEPFGFEGALPAIWSGINPETSGICTIFGLRNNSPLRHLFLLQLIAQRIKGIVVRKCPYISSAIDKFIMKFIIKLLVPTQMRRGYAQTGNLVKDFFLLLNPNRGYASIFDIPPELLKYFSFCDDKMPIAKDYVNSPTLFDLMRSNSKNFLYLQSPVKLFSVESEAGINELKINLNKLTKKKYDFACFTISSLDALGHKYGPCSKEIVKALAEINSLIHYIWCEILKNYEKVTLIVHGDHGMVEITGRIDIWSKLQELPSKIGEDYLVFLDSSMARFWFFNPRAKEEVKRLLSSLDSGVILNESDYEKYRIRFKNNKYGDLIWLANPGVLIYPNFFGWHKPVKGMHGYAPECNDNLGIFAVITNKELKFKKMGNIKMVDVFPTVCDMMNLPIPGESEGKSIVEK